MCNRTQKSTGNWQPKPVNGHKNYCPCFIAGSSMTYNLVIN